MRILLADNCIEGIENLKNAIEWEKHRFRFAAQLLPDEDLLTAIDEHQPAIVIADIHMLLSDGTSIVDSCNRDMNTPPIFIALCTEADNKLVRRAMRSNIEAFILKPVSFDELDSILTEAVEKIRNLRIERMNKAVMIINIFNRIINGDESEDTFRNLSLLMNLKEDALITYLYLDIAKYNDFDIWNDNINIFNKRSSVIEVIESLVDESTGYVFYIESGIFSIILRSGGNQGVWELCDKIIDKLDNEYALKTAAVVMPNIKVSQIYSSHMDCIECSRSISEYNTVIRCDRQVLQKSYHLDNISIRPILEAISLGDLDKIDEILNSDFKRFEINGNPLVLMRGFAATAFLEIMQSSNLTGGECSEPLSNLFKRIQTARNLYELREVCKEMCYFVVGVLLELEDTRKALVENDVITYIKLHYAEPITLETIADNFGIKQTMIGKIVKDKTGYKFKDYLNLVRVQNAQRLILSSDKKIMQIALEVGYKDYCYFVKKFRSVLGELPSEYKKQHKSFDIGLE